MYPTNVELNEKNIAKLTALFKTAYKKIVDEIKGATDFGIANRKAILAQIKTILTALGTDVDDFLKKEMPDYYKQGADFAVKQLEKIDAEVAVSTGFNRVHRDAILALVDDTSRAFGESISGVYRSTNLLLSKAVREQLTQQMALGKIKGEALRTVKNNIVGILESKGLSALVDKSGKTWQLDTYSEMLIRTKAVEARNRGMANRMVENDYDLVQVSKHGADDVCGEWEGKILSVSGKTPGYDTVADAEAAGLFHPNCKHAINALRLDVARKSMGWNPDSGQYEKGVLE